MFDQLTVNGSIQIDFVAGEIHHLETGRVYRIGTNESELLKYLCLHPHQTLTRQQLIEKVWRSKGIVVEDGSLMQTISLCRKALEDNDGRIIVTERGQGYRFTGDTQTSAEISKKPVESGKGSQTLSLNFILGLVVIFAVFSVSAYFTFSSKQQPLQSTIETRAFSLCTLTTDELAYTTLSNVTSYRLGDKQIIIDEQGRSVTFPVGSEEVTCE